MKKCTVCSHENPDQAKFCGQCGSPLNGSGPETKQAGSRKPGNPGKGKRLIPGIVIVLLIAAAGAWGIYSRSVARVERAIDRIGEVTWAEEERISKASELFRGLSSEKQLQVKNARKLADANQELARQSQLISQAEEQINALGQIQRLDQRAEVDAAEAVLAEAEVYDISGRLSGCRTTLQAAKDRIGELEQAQADLLNHPDSFLRDILNLVVGGQFDEAKQSYGQTLEKLDAAGKTALNRALTNDLTKTAGSLFTGGEYADALRLLDQGELFREYVGSYYADDFSALAGQYRGKLQQIFSRPRNGAILKQTSPAGRNQFTFKGGDQDACVKIEQLDNPENYILVYIRAGEESTIKVQSGKYRVKLATGKDWYGIDQNALFGPDGSYYSYTGTFEMQTITYTTYYWYYTYTLSTDPSLASTTPISPGSF